MWRWPPTCNRFDGAWPKAYHALCMGSQRSTIARRGVFSAKVLENNQLCLDHYQLVLQLEAFPPCRAGQFVTVRCGQVEPIQAPREIQWQAGQLPELYGPELTGRQPLLRRPFSLAGRRDVGGKVELEIIHHVIGVGTAFLAEARRGDEIELLGPLGNGFDILPTGRAVVVGGGVGIPPMLYLAQQLTEAGKQVVAFAGARTRAVLPLTIGSAQPPSTAGWPGMCTAEFAARATPTVVATDDGSLGVAGFVSQALEQWLDREQPATDDLAVYACGPAPMMRAIATIALGRGYRCQVALERHMGCGLGTCQSCVVKVKSGDPADGGARPSVSAHPTGNAAQLTGNSVQPAWQYKLACKDGPVFDAADLVW